MKELPISVQVVFHLEIQPSFKVGFPLRLIRVSQPFDLNMPFDWHFSRTEKLDRLGVGWVGFETAEDPLSLPPCLEVFVFDPAQGFAGMSPFGPAP